MLSYQVLKEKYKKLGVKYQESQNDLRKKDKYIKKLKNKIKDLNDDILYRNKKLKEKDIIIGNLLLKISK